MRQVIYILAYLENGEIANVLNWVTEEDLDFLKQQFKKLQKEVEETEPEAIIEDNLVSWVNKYGQKCVYQITKIV